MSLILKYKFGNPDSRATALSNRIEALSFIVRSIPEHKNPPVQLEVIQMKMKLQNNLQELRAQLHEEQHRISTAALTVPSLSIPEQLPLSGDRRSVIVFYLDNMMEDVLRNMLHRFTGNCDIGGWDSNDPPRCIFPFNEKRQEYIFKRLRERYYLDRETANRYVKVFTLYHTRAEGPHFSGVPGKVVCRRYLMHLYHGEFCYREHRTL